VLYFPPESHREGFFMAKKDKDELLIMGYMILVTLVIIMAFWLGGKV
jgi:hypothetical protein